MLIHSNGLLIRFAGEKDVEILSKWLSDPEVLSFYEGRDRPQSPEQVRKGYMNNNHQRTRSCIVEYHHEPIGYVQFYPLTEEEKKKIGYIKRTEGMGDGSIYR